jgi:hypothetical protein
MRMRCLRIWRRHDQPVLQIGKGVSISGRLVDFLSGGRKEASYSIALFHLTETLDFFQIFERAWRS